MTQISVEVEMIILTCLGQMCNSFEVIQKELMILSKPSMAVSPEYLKYVVVGDGPA